MIMEKMTVYLWKLKPLFCTKGLIRLLDSGGPNAVSGSYTPRSRNFLRFHHFIGFLSRFLRKWWPVSENCSYGSGHMAWYLFWTKVAQMQFPGPRPKGQEIFWDSMILLDLSHDSSENDGLFVKIEAMILDIWLDTSSEPGPRCSLCIPDPKVKTCFEIWKFYWIHLMFFGKMMTCLLKLQLRLWTFWSQVAQM